MEDIQNKVEEPKENLQEEQELLKEPESDEVQKSVVEKYGLNEETDGELINKLVEGEIESRKKLSTAIKQKRSWREKAEARTEQKPEEKPQLPAQPAVLDEKVLDQKLEEKLEERELNSLDISDELKQEVKTYAKAGGLTIKKALQSDYFKFLKEQEEAKIKVEEASIGGKRRAPTHKNFDPKTPFEGDLATEEGRKEYEEWKKARASQG